MWWVGRKEPWAYAHKEYLIKVEAVDFLTLFSIKKLQKIQIVFWQPYGKCDLAMTFMVIEVWLNRRVYEYDMRQVGFEIYTH